MSRSTFCHVKVITPVLPGRPSETFEWGGPRGAATLPGLVSVQVTTRVAGMNNFALSFAPGAGWGGDDGIAERIPAYSLVFIDMGASPSRGNADPTAIVGLTSPAIETESWQGGPPQRAVAIQGRGIECVLADADVWWAPYLEVTKLEPNDIDRTLSEPFLEELTGQIAWGHAIAGEEVDPRQAVMSVLLYYLLKHASSVMNLLLPDDHRIRDLLMPDGYTPALMDAQVARFPPKPGILYDIPKTWTFVGDTLGVTDLLLPTGTLHPQPGAILNMLECLVDRTFHELMFRYERDDAGGPMRCRILHRLRPYAGVSTLENIRRFVLPGQRVPHTRFNLDEPSLETVEITSADLLGSQLAHGMQDIKNVFFITPGQGAFFQNNSFKSLLAPKILGLRGDYGFIGRYGVRPLEKTCPYLAVGKSGSKKDPNILAVSEAMSNMVRAWYDPQPVMLEGTLAVVGQAQFRAGQRLVWHGLDNQGNPDGRPTREFYVHTCTKTYQYGNGAFTAQLGVTRGWTIFEGAIGRLR